MATAISTSPLHAAHDDPEHVEQAVRLDAINAALDQSGLRRDLLELAPYAASAEQIHIPRFSRSEGIDGPERREISHRGGRPCMT